LAAFVAESRALSAVLGSLGGPEFGRATNCPPWNLAELVVHIGMSVGIDDAELPPTPGGAPRAAADYYRRPERDTARYRQGNVDRTQEVAAAVLRTTAPAQWFDQACAAAVSTLGERELDQVVDVARVGPMTLADWVTTRVMSLAAHGIDVAITLQRPPWTTLAALTDVRPVLVDLLGAVPPAELGWDDQTLLAVGTGRRPLTDDERAVLGPAQDRFPLLS